MGGRGGDPRPQATDTYGCAGEAARRPPADGPTRRRRMTAPDGPALLDDWELPLKGEVISAVTLDTDVVLSLGEDRQHELRIGNRLSVLDTRTGSTTVVRYDPYGAGRPLWCNLTRLGALIDQDVVHATADALGRLEIVLGRNLVVSVDPGNHLGEWVYSYGSFVLACPPGGFLQP